MTDHLSLFGNDPLWLVIAKILVVFVGLLVLAVFDVWFERRAVALMQQRKGPNMIGPFGLLQPAADGAKGLLKEDFAPANVDKVIYNVAPILSGIACFLAWTVIPIGGQVTILGIDTRLQIVDLPVAILFVIAVASIGVYGIVLGGWASTSSYSLFGSLRSAAQMVSYEIAMGLSLVTVFLASGSMSTIDIVDAQNEHMAPFGFETNLPGWYAFILMPAFFIYVISMVAETNRLPFDLPECESELVSGYITDYSGFRFSMFFLAEYINMSTVSAIATTLFLGGYHAPWPLTGTVVDQGFWGPVWFLGKVLLFMFFFIWLRGTLPRLRYDQLMDLGWKVLMPAALAWMVIVAVHKALVTNGTLPPWLADSSTWSILCFIVFAACVWGYRRYGTQKQQEVSINAVPLDTFAGGYPVPPIISDQPSDTEVFVDVYGSGVSRSAASTSHGDVSSGNRSGRNTSNKREGS